MTSAKYKGPVIALSVYLAVSLIAGMAVGVSYYEHVGDARAAERSWQRQLTASQAETAAVQAQLDTLLADHRLALSGIDFANDQADFASTKLADANSKITGLSQTTVALNEEIADLEKALATEKGAAIKLKSDYERRMGETRDALQQVAGVYQTCVNELGRLESILTNPTHYEPAQAASWVREHRSLCESVVGGANVIIGSLGS